MQPETKIILTAIKNACDKDNRVNLFMTSFMSKLPANQLASLLDQANSQVSLFITELLMCIATHKPVYIEELIKGGMEPYEKRSDNTDEDNIDDTGTDTKPQGESENNVSELPPKEK